MRYWIPKTFPHSCNIRTSTKIPRHRYSKQLAEIFTLFKNHPKKNIKPQNICNHHPISYWISINNPQSFRHPTSPKTIWQCYSNNWAQFFLIPHTHIIWIFQFPGYNRPMKCLKIKSVSNHQPIKYWLSRNSPHSYHLPPLPKTLSEILEGPCSVISFFLILTLRRVF